MVNTSYRPKAYDFILNEIKNGHQAYVICPLVEEVENMDTENVTDYVKKLREIFPEEVKLGLLHGQMKPAIKNSVMEAFMKNEVQVLVSTTVVEVGVNVPNATVMMIENAERFGLAQLHQLRGRVGRGDAQSYCIMVNASDSKTAERRLSILNRSNDGFEIASEDLKLRGPGISLASASPVSYSLHWETSIRMHMCCNRHRRRWQRCLRRIPSWRWRNTAIFTAIWKNI